MLAIVLALPGQQGRAADAADVADLLDVAWESFWQQSGYPRNVYKWRDPIRVKFSGDTADRHREFALRQLQEVAAVAGIEITEAVDGAGANLEVEFFANVKSLSATEPCNTNITNRNGIIQRAIIKANDGSVWRCMLHEAMHAMGIPGHPYRNSVLTYFARSDKLTAADLLILQSVYSGEIEPGMYPFPALAVMARRLVETVAPGAERSAAQQAATAFLQNTVKQMEDYAAGTGDLPVVVLRSGRATSSGLANGRVQMQFLLGIAYSRGHIVEVDKKKGAEWLTRAAMSSHAGAQILLGDAYFRGIGVDRDPVEGYKWLYLAAEKGVLSAKNLLRNMGSQLQAEQIEEGKARAAAWQPAKI